jgi:hypothetical protein
MDAEEEQSPWQRNAPKFWYLFSLKNLSSRPLMVTSPSGTPGSSTRPLFKPSSSWTMAW